jgi:hypothetical protein
MHESEMQDAKSKKAEESEPSSIQLARIERKLSVLVLLISVQTLLLAALMLAYLIPKFLLYLQVGLVLLAFVAAVFFFRKQIPGWLGNVSRALFAFLDSTERERKT